MFNTIQDIIDTCISTGGASLNNYYIEYKCPTLFDQTGKAVLYEYAHPNSMSPNHYIKSGSLEELAWDLLRYEDGLDTIWGTV
jgi:hypothetical protein